MSKTHCEKERDGVRIGRRNFFAPQDVKNKYRYNGKEFIEDFDIGLYDYGARWYDPGIGRFMSVDKLVDHPNQVDKSPYAYAWNNPVYWTDPDGNCPWCIGALIGAATDYGLQVAGNLTEGKSFGDALSEVDGTSIATSAVLGATGAGLLSKASKIFKTGKKVQKATQVGKNASKVAKNPYLKKSASELQKSKKSFQNLVKEHKQKLKDYKANPDKFDNKGLLKKASPENRKKIIEGRVRALEKQIQKQQGELKKVNDAINNKYE